MNKIIFSGINLDLLKFYFAILNILQNISAEGVLYSLDLTGFNLLNI
jgi:hypothetical protein